MLEEALIFVWRQASVEQADTIELASEKHHVRQTTKRDFGRVDFTFDRQTLRGLEQKPETQARWTRLAHEGKRVMQFLEEGHYAAVVVDDKVMFYDKPRSA